jgi:hypothetical protein
MSLYFLLFAGTTPIGGMLVGVLSARFGVRPAVGLFGVISFLGVAGAVTLSRRAIVPVPETTAIPSASNPAATSLG